MKKARKSIGQEYVCLKPWAEDTFVQCGEKGVVFSKNGNYATAFFEAFPKMPSTFIRGEGKTVEEAEAKAFEKYTKIIDCSNHEMVRRGNSEHGICKHCGLFLSNCLAPLKSCDICGKEHVKTSVTQDGQCKTLCVEHFLQEMKKFEKVFTEENLKDLVKESLEFNFTLSELNNVSLSDWAFYQEVNFNKKWDMFVEDEEYKDITRIYDEHSNFFSFLLSHLAPIQRNILENVTCDEGVKFINFAQFICVYQELYEKMWEKFMGLNNENLTIDLSIAIQKAIPVFEKAIQETNADNKKNN